MPVYVREFVIDRVGQVHLAYGQAIALAEQVEREYARLGRPGRGQATARELRRAYATFNDELDAVAKATARDAQQRMRAQLRATRKRPETGVAPHLLAALKARSEHPLGKLATGVVGVADVAELDKVVNPLGPQYGPYWRAQEEGTTRHVGRTVYGFFTRRGYGEPWARPDPSQNRRHPIFVPGATVRALGARTARGPGSRGGRGGKMTIRNPIEARHFIRDGAAAAEAEWRRAIANVEAAAVARLRRAMRP